MKSTKIKLQKMDVLAVMVSVIGMVVACGSEPEADMLSAETGIVQEETLLEETEEMEAEAASSEAEALPEGTDTLVKETEESAPQDYSLTDLMALLGMADADTAALLGGGEENWTEDGSYYIGRIYKASFYGETFPIYTSCDDERKVNAVSVWLADGEKEVTEEDAQKWVEQITAYAEVEPVFYDAAQSESGSKSWKWVVDKNAISFYWTGDLMSININPMVGELK